jgi:hypothetical protein
MYKLARVNASEVWSSVAEPVDSYLVGLQGPDPYYLSKVKKKLEKIPIFYNLRKNILFLWPQKISR